MDTYSAERKRISRLMGRDYLWFGLFGQMVGAFLLAFGLADPAPQLAISGELVLILSTGVLLGGCVKFACFHRLHKSWAALGLLSVPGLLLLVCLPLRGRAKQRGAGFSVIFAEPYRRDVWRMDVRVILGESTATNVREPIILQLPRGTRVGTAMKTLADVIPGLSENDVPGIRYRINGKDVDRRTELEDGDELSVDIIHSQTSATNT